MNAAVDIDYTNWKGERRVRRIIPKPEQFFFGVTEYHKEPQWLLKAFDVEKKAERTFAMRDIHSWRPVKR
jgi:predicted DNA-binding transcriptional regulator YafY